MNYLLWTLGLCAELMHSTTSASHLKYWLWLFSRWGWTSGAFPFASKNSILAGISFPGCFVLKRFSKDFLVLNSFSQRGQRHIDFGHSLDHPLIFSLLQTQIYCLSKQRPLWFNCQTKVFCGCQFCLLSLWSEKAEISQSKNKSTLMEI